MDITWLFWLVVKSLALLLFAVLFLYIGREIIVYHNLSFFRKQGVKCHYIPFLGNVGLFIKKKGQHDQLATVRKFIEDSKDEPLVMINSNKMRMSTGFLLDENLIKEFLLKELDHCHKKQFFSHCNFGFFFENGEKLLEARASYSKFFNYDNLKQMMTLINKVLVDKLNDLTQTKLSPTEYRQFRVKDFMKEIFNHLVNSLVFGEQKQTLVDGIDLPQAIQEYVCGVFALNTQAKNILTLEYLHDYLILPESRYWLERGRKLEEAVWKIYQQRVQEGPRSVPNLLDLLIQRNQELKAEGKPELTKREIAGHFNLLQFAAADTSMETSTSSFMLMAKNESVKREFVKIVEAATSHKQKHDILDFEDLNRSDALDMYLNEFLRIGAPFAIIAPREFIKPTKIGKYEFRAGDRLMIPSSLINTFSKFHEHPLEFNPERFTKENLSKISKVGLGTFGFGKRTCVGKFLGELLVKTILVNFTRFMDFKLDPTYEESKIVTLAYGYEDPTLLARII